MAGRNVQPIRLQVGRCASTREAAGLRYRQRVWGKRRGLSGKRYRREEMPSEREYPGVENINSHQVVRKGNATSPSATKRGNDLKNA